MNKGAARVAERDMPAVLPGVWLRLPRIMFFACSGLTWAPWVSAGDAARVTTGLAADPAPALSATAVANSAAPVPPARLPPQVVAQPEDNIGPAPLPVVIVDDVGRTLRLPQAARRIISLAPHITEDLFAAGAGAYVVGVSDFSDYPEAARSLPRVGNMAHYDLEAIAALRPDLLIAWESGIASGHVARLKALKVPVYISKPVHLEDVAMTLENFGALAGTKDVAQAAAASYRQRLAELRKRYAGRAPLRTFFQVWHQPLATVNGQTLIADVMRLCGAENIFEHLKLPSPVVSLEAVLVANPEVIIANGMEDLRASGLEMWRHWPDLRARKRNNLYFIPPDPINRHSPRILDGTQFMCDLLDKARAKRKPGGRDNGKPVGKTPMAASQAATK